MAMTPLIAYFALAQALLAAIGEKAFAADTVATRR